MTREPLQKNLLKIVLVRPFHPGNLGAVARVMANFGFENLILVNPKCKSDDDEAIKRSKHAKHILAKAQIVTSLTDVPCDWLIGTTAKLGDDYNIPRIPLTPKTLATQVHLGKAATGLVFGPEDHGLTNEEVSLCDAIISIPSEGSYPVLNLSHAVAILLYELSECTYQRSYPLLTSKDKQTLFARLEEVLKNLDFSTKEKRETQEKMWRRLIGRSFMTKREAQVLLGFFRKVLLLVSTRTKKP